MSALIAGNLYTVLDSYKTYSSCLDNLETSLLRALIKRDYISTANRSDMLQVETFFGTMYFECCAASKLYRAVRYMNDKLINEFCNDILEGLGNFYGGKCEK